MDKPKGIQGLKPDTCKAAWEKQTSETCPPSHFFLTRFIKVWYSLVKVICLLGQKTVWNYYQF